VKCPFFRFDDAMKIGCEGPFEGVSLTLSFASKKEKEVQCDVFCEKAYCRCEIYRCIMANKYPEKDGNG